MPHGQPEGANFGANFLQLRGHDFGKKHKPVKTDWSQKINTLTPNNCQAFPDRFWGASDGIIRVLTVSYQFHSQIDIILNVVISVRDSQTQKNDGWVNLILEL